MSGEETRREDRLGEVIAGYLRSLEAGKPMDHEEYIRLHPDFADRAARPIRDAHPVDVLPQPFGRYTLLEAIGRGGMGVVYKAHDPTLKREVALKMILTGRFASPDEKACFRFEAEAAASLSHPNIVPIYEVGEEEGQLYFTMKLLDMDGLERRLQAYREDPGKAAALLRTLARAVDYAHQRAILHRDLKPGNVLLDAEGNPQIADYGLARRLDGSRNGISSTGIGVGTLGYMAPEQMEVPGDRLSTAVDVYGLGAILYSLLTGRPPNKAPAQGRWEGPESPRALNAKVDADLQAICLKCLERDPSRRYDSARSLSEDLESWLVGKPIQARPVGPVMRLWRWCRRKPALAGVILLASIILASGAAAGFMVAAFRAARRKVILENNVFMARGMAHQVQLQLQAYSRPVLEAAERPELAELFLKRDAAGLAQFLDRVRSATPTPAFESWLIVDPSGVMIARSPSNKAVGTNVDARDYSRGTKAHFAAGGERGVHVSLVYQSLANNVFMYSLCVPILGPRKELLGVLAASLSTGDTLGLPNWPDVRCRATLVGPFDPGRLPEDPSGPVPEWYILVQEGLSPRAPAIPVADPLLKTLATRSCPRELSNPANAGLAVRNAAVHDPYQKLDGTPSAAWLSGYAPVGNTGFVVIIQQREE